MLVCRRDWLIGVAAAALGHAGCSPGPRVLQRDRLRYNEAVKSSSEEQLLLNIVRLRYTDTPSSLAISSVADQYELTRSLGITPFFTADAGGQSFGGFRSMVLPQAQLSAAARPTLTYTPEDDQEFTRRLFTPLSLDAIASLSKTTWPISTVFRLWLENLNWVSNAETASGPTPRESPGFVEFMEGVQALQRLTNRKLANIFIEEKDDPVGDAFPAERLTTEAMARSAKDGFEFRKVGNTGTWRMVRKKQQRMLRVDELVLNDPDFKTFCRIFRLDPTKTTFDFTSAKLDPYFKDAPKTGIEKLDLETRSLLQVLFFISHAVELPPEHACSGVAPQTIAPDGQVFDWQQILGGLFKVHSAAGKSRPSCAAVSIRYRDHWFYIDDRDRDTKATFALLLEVSRLQLSPDKGTAGPILTLPIGGR